MKAILVTDFGGPEVLEVREVAEPRPAAGQVRIKVAATSVNFADVKARHGQYHGAGSPPFVPGLDAAGVVDAVGDGVTDITPGMRVAAFPEGGSYAEYVLANASLVYPLPDNLTWDIAAALPTVGFTAYALLTQVGQLAPGDKVVVHAAAGGVGTTAIQLARILQAGQIIGIVGHPDKARAALEAGADLVHPMTEGRFADAVLHWTHGRGADVILDSIGGQASEESLTCLANFGRLVHFGSASGLPGRIAVSDLHASCRSVRGFSLGTVRVEAPKMVEPLAHAVLDLAQQGRLRMVIGRRYPLQEAAAAHAWIESRASTGKIILTVDETIGT